MASAFSYTPVLALHHTAAVLPTRPSRVQPFAAIPAQPRRTSRSARAVVVAASAGGPSSSAASLQLASAKLPADLNKAMFVESLYQWAATLTTSGRNLPFALPLKCDKVADGFTISLLRVAGGGNVMSVADLVASVETAPGGGDVLMVRLYEGEGAAAVGMGGPKGAPAEQRLEALLSGLIDVPQIMQTMPLAIKQAVMVAR